MHWYDWMFTVLDICFFAVLFCVAGFFVQYLTHKSKNSIRLSFEDFRLHYENNPDKYGFGYYAPFVKIDGWVDIQFTCWDYAKYRFWKRNLEKAHKKDAEDCRLQRYLDFINDKSTLDKR